MSIKVCMLTGTFPPFYGGGAKQALNLCKKLKEAGIRVFVVTKNHNKWINCKEVIDGIDVYRLGSKCFIDRKDIFPINVFQFLLHIQKRYDILHCHGLYPYTLTGILASKLLNKKVIAKMVNFGGDDPITISKRVFGTLQLKFFLMADRIISTSSELTESFLKLKLPIQKLAKIPNGVDTEKFTPVNTIQKQNIRRKLGIDPHRIVVSFVGAVNKRKGVDMLIECWKDLHTEFPNMELYIIGPYTKSGSLVIDNKYVSKIFSYVQKHGLSKNIKFLGKIENVEEYLQVSDIFVFPTRGEGSPNSLLEAMACGLPCIATKLVCIEDVIQHGVNGFLFRSDDIVQLRELLYRLLKDTKLRKSVGENARCTILEKFSLNNVANTYILLYKQLLCDK